MKQVAFSQYEGSKAYITEGDYSAQSIYRIDKKTLDIKVKIWSQAHEVL